MSESRNQPKYSLITYQTRLKIINHVFHEGLTIKKTAQILGLKPSTARMILKRYKEDGIVFERKCERHERLSNFGSLMMNCEKAKPQENEGSSESMNGQILVPFFIFPYGCWSPVQVESL